MGKRMEETMKLYDSGVYLVNGNELVPDGVNAIEEVVKKTGAAVTKEQAAENTIAYGILKNHMYRPLLPALPPPPACPVRGKNPPAAR